MSPSKEEGEGRHFSRALPPLSASWWAIDTTIRRSGKGTTGLIRVRYQDGAGPATNLVVFDRSIPQHLSSVYYYPKHVAETVDQWFSVHDALRRWQL